MTNAIKKRIKKKITPRQTDRREGVKLKCPDCDSGDIYTVIRKSQRNCRRCGKVWSVKLNNN